MITCKCPYCGSEMFQVSDNIFACSKTECSVGHLSVPLQYVEDLNNCVQVLEKCYEIAKSVRGNRQLQTSDIKPTDFIMAEINKVLKRTNNDR